MTIWAFAYIQLQRLLRIAKSVLYCGILLLDAFYHLTRYLLEDIWSLYPPICHCTLAPNYLALWLVNSMARTTWLWWLQERYKIIHLSLGQRLPKTLFLSSISGRCIPYQFIKSNCSRLLLTFRNMSTQSQHQSVFRIAKPDATANSSQARTRKRNRQSVSCLACRTRK